MFAAVIGLEIIVDARGCRPEPLRSAVVLCELVDRVIAELDLHVVGTPQWHTFPGPGGVTALYLLSESHLSLHTFPEHGHAALNLYCCRPRAPWDWAARLRAAWGATEVDVREVRR